MFRFIKKKIFLIPVRKYIFIHSASIKPIIRFIIHVLLQFLMFFKALKIAINISSNCQSYFETLLDSYIATSVTLILNKRVFCVSLDIFKNSSLLSCAPKKIVNIKIHPM
jgi:hypothetical protein